VKLSRCFLVVSTAALLTVAVAGCSAPAPSRPELPRPTPTPATSAVSTPVPVPKGTIVVFAAASLDNVFPTLAKGFEKANPGTTVTFSFAGSPTLVSQIGAGAPADAFASADAVNMKNAVATGATGGSPVTFATNVLAIAVPPGNPAHITTFADLAKPGIKTVVCAPAVPCGAATATVEKDTGITLKPVSEEPAVTDVLAQVESGNADAGVVYTTDIKGADGKVGSVAFPEAKDVINVYSMVTVTQGANTAGGEAFVAYVTGHDGQKALRAAGFGAP
jgi:molybdate transport system substrate-binding protein